MRTFTFQRKMYSKRYEQVKIKDYDKMYMNEQSYIENIELKKILSKYIHRGNTVLDLGCGTRLVKRLIRGIGARYRGVDLEDWGKRGVILEDAYTHIKNSNKTYNVITSTFAIDYMNPLVIKEALKRCSYLIFTTYNRPYKEGSVSLYTGRPLYYWYNHIVKRIIRWFVLRSLEDRYLFLDDLTADDYYQVHVLEGDI